MARELTDADRSNLTEGVRSYVCPGASREEQVADVARLLADFKLNTGIELTPRALYFAVERAEQRMLEPLLPCLTQRALELGERRELCDRRKEREAVARGRMRRATQGQTRRWARQDRATLGEYLKIRAKVKAGGSITAEELERCRGYVEHHNRLVREARLARRVYTSLSRAQRQQYRNWKPSEFLAYRQTPQPRLVRGVGRRIRRSTRAAPRARAPTSSSSSSEDDPERLSPAVAQKNARESGFSWIGELVESELRRLRGEA